MVSLQFFSLGQLVKSVRVCINLFLSVHRHQINLAVLSMKESGTLMQLQNKWWMERSECPRNSGEASESDDELSLSSLAGIFYILIAGLILALVVAFCEICYASRKEARKCQVGEFPSILSPAFDKSSLNTKKFDYFQVSLLQALKANLRVSSHISNGDVPPIPPYSATINEPVPNQSVNF